jgi:hypothetical protein
MARINIEDDLFKDQRFIDLVLALNNKDTAIGALVSCWMVAQKFWKFNENGIPKTEWIKQKIRQELITVGFAEDRGDFIFVIGSKKHFSWLKDRSKAGKLGGKASSRAREIIKENFKQTQANSSKLKPLTLSLSLNTNTNTNTSDAKTSDALSPMEILEIWNQNCGPLPKAQSLNKERERQARARGRENKDPLYWKGIAQVLAADSFCRGENDRSWVATFDYFLRPGTHVKISERAATQSLRKLKSPDEKWEELS